jgi:uncharacterized membrane protein
MCAIRHAPRSIVWDRALLLRFRGRVCNSDQTNIVVPLIIILAPCRIPQSANSPRQGAAYQRSIMFESNSYGISDNAAGGLAYITIIPAIVFLVVAPFKNSSFVRFHAWQSIFFYIAWAVVHILVGIVQNLVPTVLFLTLSLWQFVDLAFFVILVIVFVQAFNGKRIMLPIVGGLAEKQANR